MLSGTRLLTLSGPGGVGKSRLGRAVAERFQSGSEGGVWWVDFGAVSDPALVDQLVLGALHLAGAARGSLADIVSHMLPAGSALLVLDNCEHLVQECARSALDVLEASPKLRVLATSRRPLGVPGEQVWRVPGFGLPKPLRDYGAQASPSTDASPAVELFVERARAARPSFELTDANRPSVIRICSALDGLPLAIELAAARAGALSVPDIAGRLERDFSLLRHAGRLAPERQRTLEAALDWSHDLLADDEQLLFRRLAVFPGSFSLEAAEAVCGGSPLEPVAILDLLASLVEQSLVHATIKAGVGRYELQRTVSRYAMARLAESGEDAAIPTLTRATTSTGPPARIRRPARARRNRWRRSQSSTTTCARPWPACCPRLPRRAAVSPTCSGRGLAVSASTTRLGCGLSRRCR